MLVYVLNGHVVSLSSFFSMNCEIGDLAYKIKSSRIGNYVRKAGAENVCVSRCRNL